MACIEEIHLGDIGTIFEITVKDCEDIVDVSSATTQEIFFLKPNKETATCITTFKTTGVDGVVQYATVANDLDVEGKWKIQFHVVLPTGEWRSDIQTFKVHGNIG